MNRDTALSLIKAYDEYLAKSWYNVPHEMDRIFSRFPPDGSEKKAMRWLGFCQGVLLTANIFTLQELKEHSRKGSIE